MFKKDSILLIILLIDHYLSIGINKKVIGLMKDELGGGIIAEFVALRPKTYSYITNEFIELKKAKGTKKCVVKKMLRFEDYRKCLFGNEIMLKLQGLRAKSIRYIQKI